MVAIIAFKTLKVLFLVGVNLTLVCSRGGLGFANLKYKVVQMCNVRLILVISTNCKIEAALEKAEIQYCHDT